MATNGFDKCKKRAVAAAKKSSRAIPQDLKKARQVNSNDFESICYKYMHSSTQDLTKLSKDTRLPAIDMLVIRILLHGITKGDQTRLNFFLDRTIGKVVEKQQNLNVNVNKTLHDEIIERLENGK